MPEGNPQKFSSKAADALDDLDSYLARVSHEDSDRDSLDSVDLNLQSTISLRDLTDVCNKCKSVTFSITSAILLNHKKCLECLLGSLVNLNNCEVSAEDGTTPIHVAAKQGNKEILEVLITKDKSLAETKDARGATATHVLCYNGHHQCLPWILKNGGSAAQKDVDGATPVHYGAASGKLECLKELIQTGNGDPNAQTYSGETPGKMWVWLHCILNSYICSNNRNDSCIQLFLCLVYFAAQEGHLACVQWLVQTAKADPTSSSNDGMTPLHAAAQTGQVNVTHWLVRTAKCPVTSKTCDGATPLHFAAAKGMAMYVCSINVLNACLGI